MKAPEHAAGAAAAVIPASVAYADVAAAAERLAGVVHHTPVFTSRTLNERTGCTVFLKGEHLQRAGAFKFRGAYNALSQLDADARRAGVISYSSGNHAQALALAGRLLGIPVLVVMPADAPAVKLAATRGYGAEVVTYDPVLRDREAVAAEIQAERGMTLVPPFDHPHIIAGQGTAALELLDAAPDLDLILAPCGGGGLLSGTAITVKGRRPDARVIGVEPEGADNGTRAFRSGRIEWVDFPQTFADGLRPKALGEHTFAVIRHHVDEMVTVSEGEFRESLAFLWQRMKLLVEPSGAVALAPLLHRKLGLDGARVGVILSGGNADVAAVSDWLGQ